jgi:hypothetical protein
MQKIYVLLLAFAMASVALISCGDDNASSKETANISSEQSPFPGISSNNANEGAQQAPASVNIGPSSPGEMVKHYLCANNCANSGSDNPGVCPVCGSNLAHNEAYHLPEQEALRANSGAAAGSPFESTPPGIDFKNQINNSGAQPLTPPSSSPAQNSKGVWHYVCSAGCSGGAGTAGNCSKCGATLLHNDDYHL